MTQARRGALLADAAMVVSLAAGVPAVGLLAYLAIGADLSVTVPLIAGPPMIGAVASVTSVPGALTLVVAATAAVALGAGALRPPTPAADVASDVGAALPVVDRLETEL